MKTLIEKIEALAGTFDKGEAFVSLSQVLDLAREQAAADAWNRRQSVKLEWREGYTSNSHETHSLYLGKLSVGSVSRHDDTNIWFDEIGGSGAQYANTVDQAKTDCEASVRASLGELI
jgi:hypothetical protein